MENIIKVLESYLDKRNGILSQKIYIVDDSKYVATDYCRIILVNKELVGDLPNCEDFGKNRIDSVFFNMTEFSKELNVSKLDDILSKIPLVKHRIVCEDCDGCGYVTYEYQSNNGRTYSIEGECPICDGKGYRYDDSEKLVPNYDDYLISFGTKHTIKPEYVAKLVETCKLLNIDSFKITGYKSTTIKFNLMEGIDVVICNHLVDNEKILQYDDC